ncbi:hypothetical protein BD560DRAFT_390505 [Blakeslea trispora]|nr:hypothetical protein BD560DRAFT_390505 [Blakeslea trispora]
MDSQKHTLSIVQAQLDQCEQQKRAIEERMATKRMLLAASQAILHDLQHAFKEDKGKERKLRHALPQDSLIPIVAQTIETKEEEEEVPYLENKVYLDHCVGWVRDRRVWIQASFHELCHLPAYLVCVNALDILPDTVMTVCDKQHGWLAFDLLPDVEWKEIEQLRIACVSQHSRPSQAIQVEWKSDQDISWQQLIAMSIHLYFPCHVSVDFADWQTWLQQNQHWYALDMMWIHQDQSMMITLQGSIGTVYSLTINRLSQFVLSLTSHSAAILVDNQKKNSSLTMAAIKSASQAYTSKTRAQLAMSL